MEFTLGDDRIVYIKLFGNYLPIGCLTGNSFDETCEMLDTTTRDNAGWATSRPVLQSYSISFSGLQINTTMAGGTFTVASYDKLKELKRKKTLLDWKIQGATFPVVDYGKGYISQIGEGNNVGEFMSFDCAIIGFGIPKTTTKGTNVLNTGDVNEIINNGTEEFIIRTNEL